MITQYMDEKGKMYLKSEELDSLWNYKCVWS